jgi:hypothetical protein
MISEQKCYVYVYILMSVNLMFINMYTAIVSLSRCILNGAVITIKKVSSLMDSQLIKQNDQTQITLYILKNSFRA